MIRLIKALSITFIIVSSSIGLLSCSDKPATPRHSVMFGYTSLAQEHFLLDLPAAGIVKEAQLLLPLINDLLENGSMTVDIDSESRFQAYKFLYRNLSDSEGSLTKIMYATPMPQYDIIIYIDAIQTHRQLTVNFQSNLRPIFANSFNFNVIENLLSDIEVLLPLEKTDFNEIEKKIKDIIMTNITGTAPPKENFYVAFSNDLVGDDADIVITASLKVHFFTTIGTVNGIEVDFSKFRIETVFNDGWIEEQIRIFFNNVLLKSVDFTLNICRDTRVITITATSL